MLAGSYPRREKSKVEREGRANQKMMNMTDGSTRIQQQRGRMRRKKRTGRRNNAKKNLGRSSGRP